MGEESVNRGDEGGGAGKIVGGDWGEDGRGAEK